MGDSRPLRAGDPSLCIVSAAIRQDGIVWSLPAPNRHHDIFRHASEHGQRLRSTDDQQGFLMSDGRFVMRKPALHVATKAKQLVREPTAPHVGLFSEDVW